MKLLQKLLLSAIITCSFTGQGFSMGAGPAAAAAGGPDFFATMPDEVLTQTLQTTLTRAANGNPNLHQFVDTFNRLRATCRRFRAILSNPARGEDILVRALGNSTINPNEALLEIAGHGQHAWLIPLLVRAGGNVNTQDKYGNTLLHLAAADDLRLAAAEAGHLRVVNELIKAGAIVRARSPYNGGTPLHYAAARDDLSVVQTLIRAGAIVNAEDNDGATPLHLATQNGTLTIVKALITAGSDINKESHYGKTPLDIAIEKNYKDIIRLMSPCCYCFHLFNSLLIS